jgi:hypothetical protein
VWDEVQRTRLAALRAEQAAADTAKVRWQWDVHWEREKETLTLVKTVEVRLSHSLTRTQNTALSTELAARIAALLEAEKSYSDPGPVYDVVVFRDTGTGPDSSAEASASARSVAKAPTWRVVVDTSESGKLAESRALADYACVNARHCVFVARLACAPSGCTHLFIRITHM